MRFVVVGAGAIGGTIGGRLFQAGHEVALVARGEHYAALRDRGLRLEDPTGSASLQVPVWPSPAEAGVDTADVVVLAVKSQDTAGALAGVVDALPKAATVPIVCAQNGVENERVALRLFPCVYGICVICPASYLHSSPVSGLLDIGRWPAGIDELATGVSDSFSAAGFDSLARADIARWKWGKLLRNLSNAVDALCGPAARGGRLAQLAEDEARRCFEAAGIAYVDEEEDAARRAELIKLRPAGGERWHGSSSWQSLARAAGSIEADYLNGEVVLLGRLHGVPTPVNAALQALAGEMARRRQAPGSLTEAEVLERAEAAGPEPIVRGSA
jgi:2-dehydropantoate 2-reductase